MNEIAEIRTDILAKQGDVTPFRFEGMEVRVVVGADGEPWFVAFDVATALGYAKPQNAIARHCKAQATAPKQGGGFHAIIPERDLYRLIMKSQLPSAERFEEWVVSEVLPSIRKTGGYVGKAPTKRSDRLVGELAIMECFTRLQHPAPSAQIAMLAHIGKRHDLDVSFLPAYAIDAAPDATGGSSMPTKPLTELLKDHGIGYTAKAYNLLLRDVGMLEERTRRTTDKNAPGGVKRYWAVSFQGLQFGKNLTSPSSPRETQPHWYVERFAELHALVAAKMARREAA